MNEDRPKLKRPNVNKIVAKVIEHATPFGGRIQSITSICRGMLAASVAHLAV